MPTDPRLTRYGPTLRALHWITALAVAVAFGVTYLEDLFARGTPERAMVCGCTSRSDCCLSPWWRRASLSGSSAATCRPSSQISRPVAIASHVVHGLLYLALIATLAVGVYLAFLRGNAVSFFSLFTIPSPVGVDRDLAREVKEVHEWLANILIILAILHAAAAVLHHVVLKDDVLRRMLPGRPAR